ncbi:MAG: acylphosphatase [Bacteroidetes bacterium]|nr:MAG: acylphosphatase [Bacteroidota bacterium]
MKHLNIRVEGTVQGVWFRDSTRKKANELEIKGFARNEPDGSVYIEAEGTEENLVKLVEWSQVGSERSTVTSVKQWDGKLQYFEDFTIA